MGEFKNLSAKVTAPSKHIQYAKLSAGKYTFHCSVKHYNDSLTIRILGSSGTWYSYSVPCIAGGWALNNVANVTFILPERGHAFDMCADAGVSPSNPVYIQHMMLEHGNNVSTYRPNDLDHDELIEDSIVEATYWVIKTSTPVIYKNAADKETTGYHTPVVVSGELRAGTKRTEGGYITITPEGGVESEKHPSPLTLEPADNDQHSEYTLKLYNDENVLLDQETIPVVYKGAKGPGAIVVDLSNDTDVLPADAAGNVTSYIDSGTRIKVFEGAEVLTYDGVGLDPGTFKVTATGTGITPDGTPTLDGKVIIFGDVSNMITDKAKIVFTIEGKTIEGKPFTTEKVQSFSKSSKGSDGDSPIRVVITPPVVFIKASSSGVITDYSASEGTIHVYEGDTRLNCKVWETWNDTVPGEFDVMWYDYDIDTGGAVPRSPVNNVGEYAVIAAASNMIAERAKIVWITRGKKLDGTFFYISTEQVIYKISDGKGFEVSVKGTKPTVSNLPPSGNELGDAWIVEADGHIYIWNGTSWTDGGQFKGDQGPPGEKAYVHYANADHIMFASNGNPTSAVGFTTTDNWEKPWQGVYSDNSPTDSQNFADYKWKDTKGPAGNDGTSVTIKGERSYPNELPPTGNGIGDGYLIDGDLWVYDGVTSISGATPGWNNVGKIQGPPGEKPYIHIAYADLITFEEGVPISAVGFTVLDSAAKAWFGVYADYELDDSQNFADYKWTEIKGAKGDSGTNYLIMGWWNESIEYRLSDAGIPVVKRPLLSSFTVHKLIVPQSTSGVFDTDEWEEVSNVEFIYMQNAYIERLQAQIVTADIIESLLIKTSKLEVLNGAKIGNFQIDNGRLRASHFYQAYIGPTLVHVTGDIILSSGGLVINSSYGGTTDHPQVVSWSSEITSGSIRIGNMEMRRDGIYRGGTQIL
jgi:hypothetical protein